MSSQPHNKPHQRGLRYARGRFPRKTQTASHAVAAQRPEKPLPPVECVIDLHDEKIDQLAKRIRESRKAHPLIDTAKKVFAQHRYLKFSLRVPKGADFKFHCCALCGEPFAERASLAEHHLHQHGEALFSVMRTEVEPPKGNFTLMGFCGVCHEPLCPPNYHRYMELLVTHHRNRHAHMPFDDFKARVKMSREAEDLDAWKKSLTVKEEFQCKHCEKKFAGRAEIMNHLTTEHAALLDKEERSIEVLGEKEPQLRCSVLRRIIAAAMEQRSKSLGPDLGRLRRAFNAHGLQFFRTAAGHQFINHVQPRRPAAGELKDALQLEIIRLAAAPARRGHKPTRKILVEQFCTGGGRDTDVGKTASQTTPSPQPTATPPAAEVQPSANNLRHLPEKVVQNTINELIDRGLLVEYLDGELDAPAVAKAESAPTEPVSV